MTNFKTSVQQRRGEQVNGHNLQERGVKTKHFTPQRSDAQANYDKKKWVHFQYIIVRQKASDSPPTKQKQTNTHTQRTNKQTDKNTEKQNNNNKTKNKEKHPYVNRPPLTTSSSDISRYS